MFNTPATEPRPPSDRDAAIERALSVLTPDEYQQYLSLADLIARRPLQFLYELVPFKEALVARLPIAHAFEIYRALVKLPMDAKLEQRQVRSLREEAARHAAVFRETAPAGVPFTVQPPKVVGNGDHRPLECVTRSLYYACLSDAGVHGRSAFIQFRDAALLDFQGEEFDRIDDRLILDLPVLSAGKDAICIEATPTGAMEIDEAFTLLGPLTPQFGHWIWEYVPKYIVACLSADLAGVPVLIDAHMPNTHREFLQMVVSADTQIVEVPYSASLRVQRLWCASRLFYIPLLPRSMDLQGLAYRTAPPDRFASAVREMRRRMAPALPGQGRFKNVFLARKPEQHRQLVNRGPIYNIAEERGFVIVYPQDLSFAEQVSLMRDASYVLGQAGSGMFLTLFAEPGTKVGILSSQRTYRSASYTCLLEELGIDVTILTGTVECAGEYAQFDDYSISEREFSEFLDAWLA
jgi:capsular polysaccharide biosynthesis protein